MRVQNGRKQIRWMLVLYDFLWYLAVALLILVFYPSYFDHLNSVSTICWVTLLGAVCVFIPRLFTGIYRMIWRYASATEFIWLILADAVGAAAFLLSRYVFSFQLTFVRSMSREWIRIIFSIAYNNIQLRNIQHTP